MADQILLYHQISWAMPMCGDNLLLHHLVGYLNYSLPLQYKLMQKNRHVVD